MLQLKAEVFENQPHHDKRVRRHSQLSFNGEYKNVSHFSLQNSQKEMCCLFYFIPFWHRSSTYPIH